MILKKKALFLLFFLIMLQSCSGGRLGNFLESSFNDLEKISEDEDLQNNLKPKKVFQQGNQGINNKNYEKIKKEEKPKSLLDPKNIVQQENKGNNNKNYEKIKEVEKQKSDLENKNDQNLEKIQKQNNKKIKNFSKTKKIENQSYKIIFILKDVDPKDPTEKLNTILRNSEVNFEIEKIERLLDSKNKSMDIN